MFERFVIQALLLDLASLVHGLHGTQHAAAFRNSFKLEHHRLLHQVCELFGDKGSLDRILVFCKPQFVVDDHLDGHGTAHRFFCRRGDCLIIGVCMQRIAVVVNGIERLQGGSDIVEVDLLRMQ